jgi:hypothetical protein
LEGQGSGGRIGTDPKRDGEAIGDLLLELLDKNIRSLVAISELTADKEWLRKQGAAEVATFFGVKHDKAVQMIEAMNGQQRLRLAVLSAWGSPPLVGLVTPMMAPSGGSRLSTYGRGRGKVGVDGSMPTSISSSLCSS